MFVPHASEFETVWSKLHEISSFSDKNGGFWNHFWQTIDSILEDVSEAKTYV